MLERANGMKFEIKHRYSGELLFSIETDTWRLAVEAAIKQKADLRYADFSCANLSYADLRYADFSSANLSYADLRYANLRSANLSYANLSYANLRCADLLIFQYQRHQAICAGERLTIGCHDKPLAEWACDYEKIGKESGYTDLQIKMYGKFIEMCVEAQTETGDAE